MTSQDRFDIQTLIARFAASFDVKDWDGLEGCLADTLIPDYSDLHGTAPETVRSSDYVSSRRESLETLKPPHLGGNCVIKYVDTVNATCRVSIVIWRKAAHEAFTTPACMSSRL